MTLWHLVQIDSRYNRQTDRQTDKRKTLGRTGRQTGQVHGQHSVVQHQESEDFITPPPPWKIQWILTDRGEEDTSCLPASFSAPLCTVTPACDLQAFKGGARRSLGPVLRAAAESKEERAAGAERKRRVIAVVMHGEEDTGVVLKKWISCPCFLISILSTSLSLVAPSDNSSFGCHLKDREREGRKCGVRVRPHHRTFLCN